MLTRCCDYRLETALRSYSALTKNDIIEIEYNSIHFELLIMETVPEGSGISVIDTDLEVNDHTVPRNCGRKSRLISLSC